MKRFCIISAAIIALGLLSGCSNAKTQEVSPPFFCVDDTETGGRVYMLGSMHACPKGTVYPEEVMSAFSESDFVACEVDTIALSDNKQLLSECSSLLLCPEGTTASDYLGESYDTIRDFFKELGIYNSAYDSYKPVMWSSLLTNATAKSCGYDSDYGTEPYFLSLAKKQGKPIIELETALEQYSVLASEPDELVRYSLENAAKDGKEAQADNLRELFSAWASANEETLTRLLHEDEPEGALKEQYALFYDKMYTERQKKMAAQVTEWLKNGDRVFMFVGALHFYASPDIPDYLEEAGYDCTTFYNSAVPAA